MKLPHRRKFLHLAAGAAALPTVSRFACAQAYPSRPIRLVVPFPPGGAFDTLARPWVEQVKPLLGTMVIENIGGGGSSLGAAAVARSRPDGYTGGTLPHVNEALFKSRPQGPGSDCGLGGRCFGACGPSISAGAQPQRVRRLCQGQCRQTVLWTRRCWLAEPADWGNVQITRGVARARAGALSGRGAGDGRPDQRASRHGHGGSNEPIARISPVRKAADSRRD